MGRLILLHGNRQHRTYLRALSAADAGLQAGFLADIGDIVGGFHRIHGREPARRLQRLAAAAAAVTDKRRILPHIFPDLHQIGLVGALQNLHGLLFGDQPGMVSVLRQGAGHIAEGHAHIPGRVDLAGMSRVIRLMAAVTKAQTDVFCLIHNMAGPFIIQNMVHMGVGQHRLLDKHPAQLGFRGIKQILYKIFLHVHVLIIKLAQIFLVDVAPGPHKGKFDKTGHGRRHHEFPNPVVFRIH